MNDAHWSGLNAPARKVAVTSRSLYVTMKDGVKVAIDLHVPRDAKGKIPAILRQTRYLRSLDAHPLAERLGIAAEFDINAKTRRRFLEAGYAWIDVDVRGTGASGGVWRCPWFDDEITDGGEIATWITQQPWSSGRVGSLGISYDGTCAEMLLVNEHPAVRAVAPLFSLHDVYADVAFPGGVHLAWFTEAWSRYNAALDRNAFEEAMAIPLWLMARAARSSPRPEGKDRLLARLGGLERARFEAVVAGLLRRALRGVRRVETGEARPPTPEQLALRAENLDVHAGAKKIVFRDDTGVHPDYPERTIDSFSPHHYKDKLVGSGAAVYSVSGWRDGAYQNAAIKRHRALGGRLTIGPWAHTGRLRIHAFGLGQETQFDHDAELLDFFDAHLKDEASRGDGSPVHYFTLGEEKWKSARAWPPRSETRPLFFASDRRLTPAESPRQSFDACNGETGTGERSRWRSLLSLVPGDYPDRRAKGRLFYESAPLDRDLEVTGHARAHVFASWAGEDGHVFVYLEDVRPDGAIAYVTEGQLRAVHRAGADFRRADGRPLARDEVAEVRVELLPISYLFRRGHRIRVAIASCDLDHFARPGTTSLRVHHGGALRSRLELPVVV
jgi:putative CocE/NonD family hydrolase